MLHRAHLVMLAEQGLIGRDDAGRLRDAIAALDREALARAVHDGVAEDLFFHLDRRLATACGADAAGRLHLARSRNDIDMTLYRMRLREHLPLGLRVTSFALDVWDGNWREIARHQGIGAQRLVRLAAPVTTRRLRLRVLDAPAGPAISEISLFRQPVLVDPPAIQRDRQGLVSIIGDAPGLELRYTLDGATPTRTAARFTQPTRLSSTRTSRAWIRVFG